MDAVEKQLAEPLMVQPWLSLECVRKELSRRDRSRLPDALTCPEVKERVGLGWNQTGERCNGNERQDERQIVHAKKAGATPDGQLQSVHLEVLFL
jgi:hypothetical protein